MENINSEPTSWFTHCHCPDEQFIEATAAFVYAPAPLPDIAEKGKAAQRALCAWKQEQRGWVISLDKRHAHLFLARSLVWTCQRLSQRPRPGLDLKFLTCDCFRAQAGRYFVHRRALQCANSSTFVKEHTLHFILRDYTVPSSSGQAVYIQSTVHRRRSPLYLFFCDTILQK